MVKTIAVENDDHKKFKQLSLNLEIPMNELFHIWIERYFRDSDVE